MVLAPVTVDEKVVAVNTKLLSVSVPVPANDAKLNGPLKVTFVPRLNVPLLWLMPTELNVVPPVLFNVNVPAAIGQMVILLDGPDNVLLFKSNVPARRVIDLVEPIVKLSCSVHVAVPATVADPIENGKSYVNPVSEVIL